MRTIKDAGADAGFNDVKIFRADEVPPEITQFSNPSDQLDAYIKWRSEMEKQLNNITQINLPLFPRDDDSYFQF